MKKREENVFCEKIYKQKGVTKIELQCWLQIQKEFDLIEYQRYISNFQKSIKKEIFNLKTEYKDEYEYFVDLNIRNLINLIYLHLQSKQSNQRVLSKNQGIQ